MKPNHLFAFFLFFIPLMLQASVKITVEDFMKFKYPRSLAVSPDGEKFVYTVRHADFLESDWQYQLWYMGKSDGEPRRLTFADVSEYKPKWSPDGKWVTFVSRRSYFDEDGEKQSGISQIWALPLAGGEAIRITSLNTGVSDYKWNPNGGFLVVLTDAEKSAKVKKREKKEEVFKFDETVKDSVKINQVFWKVNFSDRSMRRIAELDPGVDEFNISQDGSWIVYQTNYTGEYNDEQKYDLWSLNIQTGENIQLTDFPGPETDPKFSPDDRWVAYIKQTTPHIEFAETDLARIRFDTNQDNLDTLTMTKDLNLSIGDYDWLPTGEQFLLTVEEGTETPIYQFNHKQQTNRYQKLLKSGGNASDLNVVGNQIYFLKEDVTHLPEIYRLSSEKKEKLSDFSKQIESFTFGAQKIYRWKSVAGKEIEGIVFYPPDFNKTKKYPLIVTLHGGPHSRFRNILRQYYYHQVYTNKGYVLFAPNPRGSSGYSDAFGKAIWHQKGGHFGGIDYKDIMSGVNALIEEGYIDAERMGVIGGSYGGYLVNWIISQTDRFAAAVSQFGIFSLFTDWSNSWQPAWEKMYLGIYYWEEPITPDHPYVAYSPAFHVKNITTPVLILHGEDDKYTNLSNSQEMYQALKTLGREVKFVIYPREGHGINREPNHARNVEHRSQDWFDKYLKGQN